MAFLSWVARNTAELVTHVAASEFVHQQLAKHGDEIVNGVKKKLSNEDRREFLHYIQIDLGCTDEEASEALWAWYLEVRASNETHPGREDRWVELLGGEYFSRKAKAKADPDEAGPDAFFSHLACLPDEERLGVLDFLENDKISQGIAKLRKDTAEFFRPTTEKVKRHLTMPRPGEPTTLRRELFSRDSGSAKSIRDWRRNSGSKWLK